MAERPEGVETMAPAFHIIKDCIAIRLHNATYETMINVRQSKDVITVPFMFFKYFKTKKSEG